MTSVAGDDNSKNPQDLLNDFWENLITKRPAKVTNIFPASLYANLLTPQNKKSVSKGKNAAESYQVAADECRARVKRIVRECRRTNEKFTDPDFDIEGDWMKNCLQGLKYWYNDRVSSSLGVSPEQLSFALSTLAESNILGPGTSLNVDIGATTRVLDFEASDGRGGGPGSIHRVDWIFDKPAFTVDGFSSSDVRQGANGDCWFIAAVAALCSNPDLMDRTCVERDEECGVYGFVFYRDGEWIWTVIDDNLYVSWKDFDAQGDTWDPESKQEQKWKQTKQTGSDALYFAKCADQNETWLPLLEKAYAKVHGDYDSIAGGNSGEGIEDLTGGVNTTLPTNRILSKDRLWNELLKTNKEFIFSASSPGAYGDDTNARQGLALNHAYSIIKAVEEEDENGVKHRLVLIRNPWGRKVNASMGEWNGPWSDGSKQWTPYWMKKLNHRFGDDGLFWMSYDDLRHRFQMLDRTRLFNEDWTVVQQWTSASVAWVTGYLNTKFVVEIKKAGPTVFVLCQLDERYFVGLEGKYSFDLHFLLQEENAAQGEYIVRARGAFFGNRSISAEVDLEPGKYEVVPKIVASRSATTPDVYDMVTKVADRNPQKLRQIGMNYDIANAKGIVGLTEEEKKKKEEKKKAAKEKKEKEKEEEQKEKAEYEVWKKEKKEREEKVNAEQAKIKKGEAEKKETDKKDDEKEEAKKEKASADDRKETADSDSKPDQTTKERTETKESESRTKATETTKPAKEDSNSPSADGVPSNVQAGAIDPNADADAFDVAVCAAVDDAPEPDGPAGNKSDDKQKPWNAVCVLGLRVYSQDPEVSIQLVKPKDPEEGAVLDADGVMQAGATM